MIKKCTKCNHDKPVTDFYKSKTRISAYCKECFNSYCVQRWIQRKFDAIIYKGGKCHDCHLAYPGTHHAVFEFHHNNPSEKDYDWTKLRMRSWNSIVTELDKCTLLCANCHRIRHAVALFS